MDAMEIALSAELPDLLEVLDGSDEKLKSRSKALGSKLGLVERPLLPLGRRSCTSSTSEAAGCGLVTAALAYRSCCDDEERLYAWEGKERGVGRMEKGGRSLAASSPRYFRPAFHFGSARRTVGDASFIATSTSSQHPSSLAQSFSRTESASSQRTQASARSDSSRLHGG